MRFFKSNVNAIFAQAKEEKGFSLVERLSSLRTELLPLASKENVFKPATFIVEEIYEIIPQIMEGNYNLSSYWKEKGVDTRDLPLQKTLDWVHSSYYGLYQFEDIEEYKAAFMAVYEVLTSYTDLFVGRDWLDSIWRDRVLAA